MPAFVAMTSYVFDTMGTVLIVFPFSPVSAAMGLLC